ncbi:hypothetical protein J1G43_12485 [Cellulomonas sp. zg-ZUI22]|uniref:hypothetical protein n=1 Tax=Cellulomonas sp. zg-ZUI22 TaxID=2816955 RepID=UPI001A94687D|nr:hypothetical protein [Cellulomonas sp. zg-ZUI22]MBO0900783.1 hypothetical protein [Cellulomonas sp. zg-ZUI22]
MTGQVTLALHLPRGTTTVGRGPHSDGRLTDPMVSTTHVRVVPVHPAWTVGELRDRFVDVDGVPARQGGRTVPGAQPGRTSSAKTTTFAS